MALYNKITSRNTPDINPLVEAGFLEQHNRPDIRKTHLFEGRYENIYLNEQHIPALKPLIEEAIELAEDILGIKNLRAGYWFNYMPPGATTTLHTHDDDDELLSCVYYVRVPKNSGNLILYANSNNSSQEKMEIEPETGNFVFFKPDVRHEVTINNSAEHRLSIAFNFGRSEQHE